MAGTLGTLFVLPRYQGMYQGVFAAGSLLYFYEAGTSTPLDTYTSQDLSSANANPVVADAYGLFGPIYLLDRAYKVVLKTSGGVEIWSQDNVRPYSVPALNRVDPSICYGRLTLTSGTAVTTSDVTAATTVYFTPYKGNRIALYSATYGWDTFEFSELSIALATDAASLGYDVFAYDNAGTVAIERLAWTSLTARATNLTTQNGVLVKSGDPTRRYLGSYRTTGTIGQTEDSAAKRYVWNAQHRVRRVLRRLESTGSWTYTTATWRQANNSTSNQVDVFIGWAESLVQLALQASASNTNTSVNFGVSIGVDSVTSPSTQATRTTATTAIANGPESAGAAITHAPAIGHHYYAWLERSIAAGTTSWWGTDTYIQSGLTGSVDA